MPVSAVRVGAIRFLFSVLVVLCLDVRSAVADGGSDVRVLIDISGSMRQNDPDNLRRPALRMLAGLLQPGTRAGVWTFARWVNNLVPVADVDKPWKARVQSLSEQIGSPGQFTNIEMVLDEASRDWIGTPGTQARHLVLLTDGMVDISKRLEDNASSRGRILDELLPRLQGAGVKIHTIALSGRADHELMERLAGESGGWYQQVAVADELQRAFLRMFETVGAPDAVPLQDNRFTVDGSISEATVLAFSRPDSAPVVLHAPSGETFTDSDLPAGVAWYRDQGYDLITIASPQPGEWRLQADLDPDNRVMVVTDLKLQVSEVPRHLAVGEEITVEAHLSNHGELVSRPAFLRLLEVRAAASSDGEARDISVDEGAGADAQARAGRFQIRYRDSVARPSVELLVAVESPTFMREKRLRLAIHEPFDARIEQTAEGPVLSVKTDTAVLRPDVRIEAWQQDPQGQRQLLEGAVNTNGEWTAALGDPGAPVYLEAAATTRQGKPVDHRVGPLTAPGVELPVPVTQEPVAESPSAAPGAETPAAEPVPAAQAVAATSPDPGWLMPAILFGGLNLLLLLTAGGWWYLRRRAKRGESDSELLLIDAGAAVQGAAETPVREDAA